MLTLICGMPRAGKTTYSKRYENVIHFDGLWHVKVLELVAQSSDDVVVEGLYFHANDRIRLLNAYRGEGKKCIWLDTPLEVRKTRPMWRQWADPIFEPPTINEGWDEIMIIRGENDVECYSRQTEN